MQGPAYGGVLRCETAAKTRKIFYTISAIFRLAVKPFDQIRFDSLVAFCSPRFPFHPVCLIFPPVIRSRIHDNRDNPIPITAAKSKANVNLAAIIGIIEFRGNPRRDRLCRMVHIEKFTQKNGDGDKKGNRKRRGALIMERTMAAIIAPCTTVIRRSRKIGFGIEFIRFYLWQTMKNAEHPSRRRPRAVSIHDFPRGLFFFFSLSRAEGSQKTLLREGRNELPGVVERGKLKFFGGTALV